MWSLFVGAWLSISPLPGQSDTTSVVIVEWWAGVGKVHTNDISIYTITDSIKNYKIYEIAELDSIVELDGFVEKPKNTYLYRLVVEKIPYKKFMYCTAKGYGTDYFYHYGFTPNNIKTPMVEIR